MANLEDTILVLLPEKQWNQPELGIPPFWPFAPGRPDGSMGCGEDFSRPVVVLPESWKTEDRALPQVDGATVVCYSDERSLPLPANSIGDVWILDGSRRPVVDWESARIAARRRECDVLVFGTDSGVFGWTYSESVRVDQNGQVMGFTRHYGDSPASADPWSEPASALVCDPQHARAVAAHVMLHGWELDSIGGLTRRFHVSWSDDALERRKDRAGYAPFAIPAAAMGSARKNRIRAGESAGVQNGFVNLRANTLTLDRPARNAVPMTGNNERRVNARPSTRAVGDERRFVGPTKVENEDGAGGAKPDAWLAALDGEAVLMSAGLGYRIAKRCLDIFLSAAVLLVLAPLLAVVAAMVKLTSKGPVFFGHVRQGLGGKEFHCLKFRTMIEKADAMQAQLRGKNEVDGPQFKMSNDPRLTWLGVRLQRYNIDEIPQFFNVLRGDMSLVGPRPSPDKENQFCPGWRRARLSVRPGITGLWQVLRLREKSHSDFQEWIYYDLEYVRYRSFWLDCQILFYTPVAMFASSRLVAFAKRLQLRGICVHSAQIPQNGLSSLCNSSDRNLDGPTLL